MNGDKKIEFLVCSGASVEEAINREKFEDIFEKCPIKPNEMLNNLGLFIRRQALSRIIFMHELYLKTLPIHGVVMEFGVRWGQNLALFSSFRGMYEPYNYNRKIIGFDTFEGFPSVSEKDGNDEVVKKGAYSVSEGYESYLTDVLDYHETESPLGHIKKYEIVKGDATKTLEKYLKDNPHTIISFAYFDFDIYEPTKKCLELIKPHLTKGSVIGFDELNYDRFPGETIALQEVFGLGRYSIQRSPLNPVMSYIVID